MAALLARNTESPQRASHVLPLRWRPGRAREFADDDKVEKRWPGQSRLPAEVVEWDETHLCTHIVGHLRIDGQCRRQLLAELPPSFAFSRD